MSAQANDRLRVMLADVHAIFGHGMGAVIEHTCPAEVVAERGDGESALATYLELRPDVLLLDLRMTLLDGLEVLRRVLEADRAARIFVMTTYAIDQDIAEVLRAAARGYPLKDAVPQYVGRAIVRVAEGGGMCIAPDIAAQYGRMTKRAELSPRELQILRMVGADKPNKDIVRNLSLELTTVKGDVKSVLAKLGVRNRTEALSEACAAASPPHADTRLAARAGRLLTAWKWNFPARRLFPPRHKP
ncbi:MAG: two component transcriptional regulator, LuxR family [Ramlibacter sp.]|nr:two component transcriptional regulator, LuxR family [Ramlibacter sp.]